MTATDTMPTRVGLTCKHCPASTRSSHNIARAAGWRTFQGASVTGKPIDDVVCPACAGTAPAEDAPEGWRVRCHTCDWTYQDEDEEGPLSPAEARQVAADHECQPDVELAPPSGDKWFRTSDIDRDGNLRGKYVARAEPERWLPEHVGPLVLAANGDL